MRHHLLLVPVLVLCLLAWSDKNYVFADDVVETADLPSDLSAVALDALLNFDLVVTLPGRKEQRLSEAASAVYVLSNEDIRRSGVTHVAEALRLVPGVNVARVSSNKWAISVRGFNQIFANKLLVLIDGVSIFSPTTNGVYWESNEIDLDDVDRIEVIRGPGAALWGSNAVNGVINIVTKKASETQGLKVKVGGGTHERAFAKARYGGKIDEDTHYRAYTLGHKRTENQLAANGEGAEDDWESYSGGFRIDSKVSTKDTLTLEGDLGYQSDFFFPTPPSLDPPFVDPVTYTGNGSYHDLRSLLNWTRAISADSSLEARISYSRKDRETKLATFTYDILNIEAQHRFKIAKNHDLVYGGGYRYFYNSTIDSPAQEISPATRKTDLFNGYIQDEITLIPEELKLILGSKFENSQQIGTEFMPNGRVIWNVNEKNTVWGAVSSAIAPPAVFFEDSSIPVAAFPASAEVPLPGVVSVLGSRALDAEDLIAYEAGIRTSPADNWSVDLSGFFNRYDNLYSLQGGAPFPGFSRLGNRPALVVPIYLQNELSADSYGAELASEIKISESLTSILAYSYLNIDVNEDDDGNKELAEDGSPQHQISLRGLYNISDNWELDGDLRYIDSVPYVAVGDYFELNLRLGWRFAHNMAFSVVGQNLLHSSHAESVGNLFGPPATEIERGVYGYLTVDF